MNFQSYLARIPERYDKMVLAASNDKKLPCKE